ncbi:ABC transporter substrate-binding protein [Asaia siamensis]
MKLSRRALLASIPAATLLPQRSFADDLSQVTLRVATFRGADQTLLRTTGLDDFPYKVVFSEFNSGNLIARAIDADAIDLGAWSEIPMVFAASSGARVAVAATLEGPTTNQAVLVPTRSPLKNFSDLRGKRVGYIRSTTTQYFLLKMLARHNMTLADITPVALGMSEGLTALKSGSLDAWATYGYAIEILEADNSARILESAEDILSGHYFIGINPQHLGDTGFKTASADYINRLGKAYSQLNADKPRWARAVAPDVHVPEPLVLSYLNHMNRAYHTRPWKPSDIATASEVAHTLGGAGALPPNPNLASVFTPALSSLLNG